jgi:metal-responsive CopG/Arc/MetJ family transcriptional regulator
MNTETTEPKDQRVVIMMTRSELKAVDDRRFARHISSRGEAIRQLVALGLKASEQQETEESAASMLAREEGLHASKRKGKV